MYCISLLIVIYFFHNSNFTVLHSNKLIVLAYLAMLTAAENKIDKKYLISLDWADRTFSREFESLFFKSTIRVKQK